MSSIRRINTLKTPEDFQSHLDSISTNIPFDAEALAAPESPLSKPLVVDGFEVGNRFSILPMEGWDAESNGRPSELVRRRWFRFGLSGAKLIWGGEAVAVRHDGRANPNQLVFRPEYLGDFVNLREHLLEGHRQFDQNTSNLLVGLQLTHSGRFARPNDKKRMEPRILYHHPVLENRYKVENDQAILSDDEIKKLIDDFINAAVLAQKAGFDFVDVKHCHGYLGHEFLSSHDRPGAFGGSFENRTRFLREIVAGIKAKAPGLRMGVRLSIYDFLPFKPGEDRRGVPETWTQTAYPYAFGGDETGLGINLDEPVAFLKLCAQLGIRLICTTAGSPYYTPHLQRPALFPPSDAYQPPEEPLIGVARQIHATHHLKKMVPDVAFVGSGYSYLQDWLPRVGQATVRNGMVDFIGLGRMVLSYPEMPADSLLGRELERKKICRTFSDCTTAPRNGIISGCYPLDPFYKNMDEARQLTLIKKSKE